MERRIPELRLRESQMDTVMAMHARQFLLLDLRFRSLTCTCMMTVIITAKETRKAPISHASKMTGARRPSASGHGTDHLSFLRQHPCRNGASLPQAPIISRTPSLWFPGLSLQPQNSPLASGVWTGTAARRSSISFSMIAPSTRARRPPRAGPTMAPNFYQNDSPIIKPSHPPSHTTFS